MPGSAQSDLGCFDGSNGHPPFEERESQEAGGRESHGGMRVVGGSSRRRQEEEGRQQEEEGGAPRSHCIRACAEYSIAKILSNSSLQCKRPHCRRVSVWSA